MIKKTCGYLDDNRNFHKTKMECSNANIEYKIRKIRSEIEDILRYYSKGNWENFSKDGVLKYEVMENLISKIFFHSRKRFKEVLNSIENLEKEISELNKLQSKPYILRKDWWRGNIISYEK